MSIRPIDMQVSVQNTPEINRTQNNETNRPTVANQQFAEQLQKEVRQNDQQVVQSNRSEEGLVDKDGKGASREYEKRKNRREVKKDEKKKSKGSTSMFDVSI